jgi:hypothetical protein
MAIDGDAKVTSMLPPSPRMVPRRLIDATLDLIHPDDVLIGIAAMGRSKVTGTPLELRTHIPPRAGTVRGDGNRPTTRRSACSCWCVVISANGVGGRVDDVARFRAVIQHSSADAGRRLATSSRCPRRSPV